MAIPRVLQNATLKIYSFALLKMVCNIGYERLIFATLLDMRIKKRKEINFMAFFLSQFFSLHFSVSNALLRAVQGVPFITLWILKAWRFRVCIIQFITRLENAHVINFRMHENKNVTFILHGVSENQIYETLEREIKI